VPEAGAEDAAVEASADAADLDATAPDAGD